MASPMFDSELPSGNSGRHGALPSMRMKRGRGLLVVLGCAACPGSRASAQGHANGRRARHLLVGWAAVLALETGSGTTAHADELPRCTDGAIRSTAPIPASSRLLAAIGVGVATTAVDHQLDGQFLGTLQLGVALWARECVCEAPSSLSLRLDSDLRWTRWSFSLVGDVLWRSERGTVGDVRPALRLERSNMRYQSKLETSGAWLSVGPTFDHTGNGVSAGVGVSVYMWAFEARIALHSGTSNEGMFIFGPKLHRLWQ